MTETRTQHCGHAGKMMLAVVQGFFAFVRGFDQKFSCAIGQCGAAFFPVFRMGKISGCRSSAKPGQSPLRKILCIHQRPPSWKFGEPAEVRLIQRTVSTAQGAELMTL